MIEGENAREAGKEEPNLRSGVPGQKLRCQEQATRPDRRKGTQQSVHDVHEVIDVHRDEQHREIERTEMRAADRHDHDDGHDLTRELRSRTEWPYVVPGPEGDECANADETSDVRSRRRGRTEREESRVGKDETRRTVRRRRKGQRAQSGSTRPDSELPRIRC